LGSVLLTENIEEKVTPKNAPIKTPIIKEIIPFSLLFWDHGQE